MELIEKTDTDCYQQIAAMSAGKLFYWSLKCFDWELFIYFCKSYFFFLEKQKWFLFHKFNPKFIPYGSINVKIFQAPRVSAVNFNKNSNFTLGNITAKRKFFAKIALKEIHLSGHRVGSSL